MKGKKTISQGQNSDNVEQEKNKISKLGYDKDTAT